jgi:hypothetical protein
MPAFLSNNEFERVWKEPVVAYMYFWGTVRKPTELSKYSTPLD